MIKKEIETLFNERIKKSIEARRERHPQIKRGSYLGYDVQLFAPVDGYELLHVNNKPNELLFIKEQCKKDFCAFVVVTTWNNGETGFISFDFTADKKEICAPDFIGASFSNCGKGSRKYAKDQNARIYAVFNSKLAEYKEAVKKHQERAEMALHDKYARYKYNDQDFSNFREAFRATFWGCSYNSLNDEKYDSLSSSYIDLNGRKYEHTAKTRKELYSQLVDRSGYPVAVYRQELKQRAEKARLEKARAEVIAEAKAWQEADKTEAKQNILFFRDYFKDEAEKYFKKMIKNNRFDFYAKNRLDDIVELCEDTQHHAEKIEKLFNSFESVGNYIKHIKESIKKCEMLKTLTERNPKTAKLAYAWSWWEMNEQGELINTYKNGEYFKKIFVKNGVVCGSF